jgi:AhpD family alkylhydroperoxidase
MTFPEHTPDDAPDGAGRLLTAVARHQGFLPIGVARLASSTQALEGFLKLSGLFESCTLTPLARETLIMAVAVSNGCELCVALHTARLRALDAPDDLVQALRASAPVADPRLRALQVFTERVRETAGAVGDEHLTAFLDAGFTHRQALEVVLGISTYTLSTFANRLTGAPVDDELAAHA